MAGACQHFDNTYLQSPKDQAGGQLNVQGRVLSCATLSPGSAVSRRTPARSVSAYFNRRTDPGSRTKYSGNGLVCFQDISFTHIAFQGGV
jgi:hypothetical protein